MLSPADLESTEDLHLAANTSAERYDVFGTANFFNFCPLTASIRYLLDIGIEHVQEHNDTLVEVIVSAIDTKKYYFISPILKEKRSALVVLSHKDPSQNKAIFDALTARRIYGAFWKGNIRFSPHIFNTPSEIDQLVTVLNALP
jgi:selenocysteine lyase/cysteine desulfurase